MWNLGLLGASVGGGATPYFIGVLKNNVANTNSTLMSASADDAKIVLSAYLNDQVYNAGLSLEDASILWQNTMVNTTGDTRTFGSFGVGGDVNALYGQSFGMYQDEITGNSDPILVKWNDDGTIAWQSGVNDGSNMKAVGIVQGASTRYGMLFRCDDGTNDTGFASFAYDTGATEQTWRIDHGNGPRGISAQRSGYQAHMIYAYDNDAFANTVVAMSYQGGSYWARKIPNGGKSEGAGVAKAGADYFSAMNTYDDGNDSSRVTSLDRVSGSWRWGRRINGSQNFRQSGIAGDTLGNTYALLYGFTLGGLYLVKFDSSGNVLWQRSFESNTSYLSAGVEGRNLSVDANGDLLITAQTDYSPLAFSSPVLIRYPADGSITGTFTVDGEDFVISASSLTISNESDDTSSVTAHPATSSFTTTTKSLATSTATFTEEIGAIS